MKNDGVDIFEIVKKGRETQFRNSSADENSNFFVNEPPKVKIVNRSNGNTNRRLNDYDFNLLKEDAYKDVSDDVFKLEYKISKTEDELRSLDAQIQAARDISDHNLIESLEQRKNLLSEDYEALIAMYNDKSLSARISENVSSFLGANFQSSYVQFKSKFLNFSETLMSKLPGPFSSVVELKKSLNKLENINKSVDELMTMNMPYGENYNKYEQLSKFIIKANSIQAEINRYMNNK